MAYSFYAVGTRIGRIRFDSNMSNFDVIADSLQHMSDGNYRPAQPATPV